MPAVITHDAFGNDLLGRIGSLVGSSKEESDAFLLGNQGPDPLFYVVLNPLYAPAVRLGSLMHKADPAELLPAFKQAAAGFSGDQEAIARAYVLGLAAHWRLDRTVHPFVYAQQYQLCNAGVEGLGPAQGHEVHALIESELDELVLWKRLGQTIATFDPSRRILHGSAEVLAPISRMYATVADRMFQMSVAPEAFAAAVAAHRLALRGLYSPSGVKREVLATLERLVRPYSFLQALSHRDIQLEDSSFANSSRTSWEDPFSGEVSNTSFFDLYDRALVRAQTDAVMLAEDDFDEEAAYLLTGSVNFSGRPTRATIVSVEDHA